MYKREINSKIYVQKANMATHIMYKRPTSNIDVQKASWPFAHTHYVQKANIENSMLADDTRIRCWLTTLFFFKSSCA